LVDRVVDFHYGRLVTAPVAVVRGGEDRDDAAVVLPLVPLHHELMRPCYEVQAVDVSELFGDVLAEGVPGSPR